MEKFQPLYDHVLIQQENVETGKTKGGLFIPETAKEKPAKGKVLAVGQGKAVSNSLTLRPLIVKVGDNVLFDKFAGKERRDLGDGMLIMDEDDILGVLV